MFVWTDTEVLYSISVCVLVSLNVAVVSCQMPHCLLGALRGSDVDTASIWIVNQCLLLITLLDRPLSGLSFPDGIFKSKPNLLKIIFKYLFYFNWYIYACVGVYLQGEGACGSHRHQISWSCLKWELRMVAGSSIWSVSTSLTY